MDPVKRNSPRIEQLDGMLDDGLSERRRRAFAEARLASAGRGRTGLAAALDWNQALRGPFGDRPASKRVFKGGDYRI